MGKLTPKTKSSTSKQRLKALHPNSRKVRQLAKKQLHKIKVHQRKSELSQRCRQKVDKFTFFHNCLPEGCNRLDGSQMALLIEGYFARFDDELKKQSDLFKMRGNNNQHASRCDAIKMTLDKEKQEYQSGTLEIPDLFSTEGFKIFKDWDLKTTTLQKVKTKLVSPAILTMNHS